MLALPFLVLVVGADGPYKAVKTNQPTNYVCLWLLGASSEGSGEGVTDSWLRSYYLTSRKASFFLGTSKGLFRPCQ